MNDWNASHPGEERGSSGDAACPKLIPRRRSSESCASPAVAHDHTSHNTASIHTSEHNPPIQPQHLLRLVFPGREAVQQGKEDALLELHGR